MAQPTDLDTFVDHSQVQQRKARPEACLAVIWYNLQGALKVMQCCVPALIATFKDAKIDVHFGTVGANL